MRFRGLAAAVVIGLCGAGALPPPAQARHHERAGAQFPDIGYATWTDAEPPYRLYPGDEISVSFPAAPELNTQAEVGPDGRIALPLVGSVMAADLTIAGLERTIDRAYGGQLIDPQAEVAVRKAGPLKVYVAGEVGHPGVYDMVGDMDALRAIVDAGGFTTSAKESQVVIIRRGPDGRAMMRTLDLKRALRDPAGADLAPLRRFDVIYVPRTRIAEAGLFVQHYIRDLLPGSVGFSYSVGGQGLVGGVP